MGVESDSLRVFAPGVDFAPGFFAVREGPSRGGFLGLGYRGVAWGVFEPAEYFLVRGALP